MTLNTNTSPAPKAAAQAAKPEANATEVSPTKELLGQLMGAVGKAGQLESMSGFKAEKLETILEIKRAELEKEGLEGDALTKELDELSADYKADVTRLNEGKQELGDAYKESISKIKTEMQEAFQSEGKSPEQAKAMVESIHNRLKQTIGNPESGKNFNEAFDDVVTQVDGLDVKLSEGERDDLDDQYAKTLEERQRVKQMLHELNEYKTNGTLPFRVFGIGMDIPTHPLDAADFMTAADHFLDDAIADGSISISAPKELAWQKALLGAGSHYVASQESVRKYINIGGKAIFSAMPAMAGQFIDTGKEITKANWKEFITQPQNATLGQELKDAGWNYLKANQAILENTDLKVTSAERIRHGKEMYFNMVDPDGTQYAYGNLSAATVKLIRQQLTKDPNFPNDQIDAMLESRLGNPPKARTLFNDLNSQIREKLATRWTETRINAKAQIGQLASNMNYEHTMWKAQGGHEGLIHSSQEKYIIMPGQSAPAVDYEKDKGLKRDGNTPKKKGEITPTNPYEKGRQQAGNPNIEVGGDDNRGSGLHASARAAVAGISVDIEIGG